MEKEGNDWSLILKCTANNLKMWGFLIYMSKLKAEVLETVSKQEKSKF